MKQVMMVAGTVVGVCVAYILAHLALIEIGREVVVVYEPTPTGQVHKARLWIVDDGSYAWIHPGSANAQWWVRRLDKNPIVEIDRGGERRVPSHVWNLALHLLLTAVESFSVHARFGGSVVEFRIRIVGIFGARNGTSQRWRQAVHTDSRSRLGSRIQPSPGDSHI